MKKLGIIGGMGPLATAFFIEKWLRKRRQKGISSI